MEQNHAFVSSILKLRDGESLGQSHVNEYSCVLWSGDGTNKTNTKVVTLNSNIPDRTISTSPSACKSPQANFQIRVLDTDCETWDDLLKKQLARNFQNAMLSVINAECEDCSILAANVTYMGTPVCSTVVEGAANFRGSISASGAGATVEDIFCTLDAWLRTGPLLQVNNRLLSVDQTCTLMLDHFFTECAVSPVATMSTVIAYAIGSVLAFCVALLVILIIFISVCIRHYHGKRRNSVEEGKMITNNGYEM